VQFVVDGPKSGARITDSAAAIGQPPKRGYSGVAQPCLGTPACASARRLRKYPFYQLAYRLFDKVTYFPDACLSLKLDTSTVSFRGVWIANANRKQESQGPGRGVVPNGLSRWGS
jgi:hypothetical protein